MSEDAGRKPDSRLRTIAGRWQTSGHVIDEPTIPVAGTDTYEVLPGGYFLLHHVDVTVGDKPVRAIEIIGEPDAASGGFLAPSFDDDGNTELMHVTIDDTASSTSPAEPRLHRPHKQTPRPRESDPHSPSPRTDNRCAPCGSGPRMAATGSAGWISPSGGVTNATPASPAPPRKCILDA